MGLTWRDRSAALLVTVGAAVALPGCGSSPPRRADVTGLHRAIAQVRSAAQAGDRAKALGALTTLGRLVAGEADVGHLSAADVSALRIGIARARQRISAEVPAPAAPVRTPAAPPATPAQSGAPAHPIPGRGKHAGKKARGKGHKP